MPIFDFSKQNSLIVTLKRLKKILKYHLKVCMFWSSAMQTENVEKCICNQSDTVGGDIHWVCLQNADTEDEKKLH